MFFLMREALRLATVDFLLSEVALVTVDCASAIVKCGRRRRVEGGKVVKAKELRTRTASWIK